MLFPKKLKRKTIRKCEGAISLFLCLLMTPFLTLASALVEFSRYQQTVELLKELIDCTSLSVLANYDDYLQERFGLFGVSQNRDISDVYSEYLERNTGILGKAVSIDKSGTTAAGISPLSDYDTVLRSQLMDFCESTVTVELILEDLHLGDIISTLEEGIKLDKIEKVTGSVEAVTTDLTNIIDKADQLKTAVDELNTTSEKFREGFNSYNNTINSFLKKLSDDGVSSVTAEVLKEDYIDNVKEIYGKAHDIISTAISIESQIKKICDLKDEILNSISKLGTDSASGVMAISDLKPEKKEDDKPEDKTPEMKTPEDVSKAFDDANKKMTESLNKTLNDPKTWAKFTISKVKEYNEHISDMKKMLSQKWGEGISSASVSADTYFTGDPLSESAQKDLNNISNTINSLLPYYGVGGDTINEKLRSDFPADFFNDDFSELSTIISTALEDCVQSMVDGVNGSRISDLITLLESLFDFDLFFNDKMNAYLAYDTVINEETVNPFVKLLEAIEMLISAGKSISDALSPTSGKNIIERGIELAKAVGKVVGSIGKIVEAFVDVFGAVIEQIAQLASYFKFDEQGFMGFENFFTQLLLAGYSVYNLPNRTMGGDMSDHYQLTGKGLTGFDYKDIAICTPWTENPTASGGFSEIVNFFVNSVPSFTPKDQMLKGAELEYVAVGTRSEIMNQVIVFLTMYYIRLQVDGIAIALNTEVAEMAAAASIAAPVVYLLVIFIEPLLDCFLLVNSSSSTVPLIKSKIFLTPSGISSLVGNLGKMSDFELIKSTVGRLGGDTGYIDLDYQNHMFIILMLSTNTDDLLLRLSNLIHFETAYHYKQAGADYTFSLRNAYTEISADTKAQMNSFISVFQSSDQFAAVTNSFSYIKGY